MLSFWDIGTGALLCTIPVYEGIEGVQALPADAMKQLLRKPNTAGSAVRFIKLRRAVADNAE